MRFPCPCCGYFTYPVPVKEDIGFICPVCFWENDPFVDSDEEPSDSNHHISLAEGRENFQEFRACEASMLKYVRDPMPKELTADSDNASETMSLTADEVTSDSLEIPTKASE